MRKLTKIYHVLCLLAGLSILASCSVLAQSGQNKEYNVLKYGVVGDGKTLNNTAIQSLIDECSRSGGGVVRFPAGKYVAGTILLKDNVTLSLDENAELLGSTDISNYQLVDPFKTGNGAPMGYCFVGAVDAKNVGIIGKGTINGRGKEVFASGGRGKRPFLIRFVRSSGITLQGIKLLNSTAWTAHFFACKNINIDGVEINSRGLGNNDGFDIDSSQDVKISNCTVDSGDDGLCFKSTWSKMACKNIEVTGMKITSNHGGIKFGTESTAPFENIKISNCYIYNTRNGGIKINSVDGANVKNISISDIVMDNVRTVMLMRLGSRLNVFKEGDEKQQTGTFENVSIRNIKATMPAETQLKPPSGILITGVPGHYIKNVSLENIDISLIGGGTAEHARHQVPEAENKYPEISTFGPTIPAYGLWARHVEGLTLNNIRFKVENPDMRPAFIVEDGKEIAILKSSVPAFAGAESVIRFENVREATVKDVKVSGKAASLVRVEGEESAKIIVTDNQAPGIEKKIDLGAQVKKDLINDKK